MCLSNILIFFQYVCEMLILVFSHESLNVLPIFKFEYFYNLKIDEYWQLFGGQAFGGPSGIMRPKCLTTIGLIHC